MGINIETARLVTIKDYRWMHKDLNGTEHPNKELATLAEGDEKTPSKWLLESKAANREHLRMMAHIMKRNRRKFVTESHQASETRFVSQFHGEYEFETGQRPTLEHCLWISFRLEKGQEIVKEEKAWLDR